MNLSAAFVTKNNKIMMPHSSEVNNTFYRFYKLISKFQEKAMSDATERMNFLYQAAFQVSQKSNVLSSFYGEQCSNISQKSLQRMYDNIYCVIAYFITTKKQLSIQKILYLICSQHDVKRLMCKKCGLILRPNVSLKVYLVDANNNPSNVLFCCEKCCKNRCFSVHVLRISKDKK